MSVLTAILAFAPAIAAKVKSISPKAVEKIDLELFEARGRIGDLKAALAIANSRIAELENALELERRSIFRGARLYDQRAAQSQMAQAQYNQAIQAQNQLGTLGDPGHSHGLQNWPAAALGAQNLLGTFEDLCNCVPARHDMFLPRR